MDFYGPTTRCEKMIVNVAQVWIDGSVWNKVFVGTDLEVLREDRVIAVPECRKKSQLILL
jgi:hypothetical protein